VLAFGVVGDAAIDEGAGEAVIRFLARFDHGGAALIWRSGETPSVSPALHHVRACDCCACTGAMLAGALSATAHAIVRIVTTIRHQFAVPPSCNCAPGASTWISVKQLLKLNHAVPP